MKQFLVQCIIYWTFLYKELEEGEEEVEFTEEKKR